MGIKTIQKLLPITMFLIGTPLFSIESHANETKIQSDETRKPNKGIELILNSGDIYYSKYNLDMTDNQVNGENRSGYNLFSIPLQVKFTHYFNENTDTYIAPYFNYTIRHDVGGKAWNKEYWVNNQTAALGLQLGIANEFRELDNKKYMGGLYLSLFSEFQYMDSSILGAKNDIPASVATNNFKTGTSVWYAQKKLSGNENMRVWTEVWGEFAYQSTNFYAKGKDNYLIANIAPKAGLSFDVLEHVAVEPYVTANWKKDFMNKEWNDVPWNNSIQYGPGVRIALTNNILPGEPYFYSEYLFVNDLSKTHQDLSHDLRIGLNYWVKLF